MCIRDRYYSIQQVVEKKESNQYYTWGLLWWCSSINRICSCYNTEYRDRLSNGWVSFLMDPNTYLEYGIACKKRLYKSRSTNAPRKKKKKKICTSDSRNNSSNGRI